MITRSGVKQPASGGAVLDIKDQLYLDIKIGGESLPDSPSIVSNLSIHDNANAMTPTMQMRFTDLQRILTGSFALTEGTQLSLMLGKTRDSAVTRNYRLFNIPKQNSSNSSTILANFVLDVPKYITGSVTEAYEGTSAEALSQLAKTCGLKSLCSKTTDHQIWYNFAQTRASFAEDVAVHGYNNGSSCMFRALTSQGVLLYKDVFYELNHTKPKITFGLNSIEQSKSSTRHINVRDFRDISSSGMMNTYVNYGWTFVEHSLTGKQKINNALPVKMRNPFLPINADVKKIVGNSKIEYCKMLDCRNTHANYNKAYYENIRGRALLSNKITILIEEVSGVNLLDIVEFRSLNEDGNKNNASGSYFVTAIVPVVAASGSYYAEKLELCRPTITEAGITPLVGD